MKYIRTADGRIMKHPHPNEEVFTSRYKIVKCADSIKDLCDEFVFDDGDNDLLLCDNYEELLYWFNYSKKQQFKTRNCYGAIWTDKLLLYVAKLNNKGEFELI